jgi:hypothetical protein
MSTFKDITGNKFGRWTVINRTENKSSDGSFYWLCRCDCGIEREVRGQNLRNGNSRMCHASCPLEIYEKKCKIFDKKTILAANGCWIWTGLKNHDNYGQIGDSIYAHRFSYERFIGKIPENMCVCHTCDITYCVNPKHLWLGLRGDNNLDRKEKNRSAIGEKSGKAKLTKNVVIKIRNLYKEGNLKKADLARKFKVKASTISQVLKRETWKHV